MKRRSIACLVSILLLSGCAASPGPSPDLRLRRVVLYQNGIGYFERSGFMEGGRLRMTFRERDVDDVLKSIVVVEEGLDVSQEKPSTVNLRLVNNEAKRSPDDTSTLDLMLSREVSRRVSIAYATPTAAWKATYRVILPTKESGDKRALLQAWALIDNVSDEDWTGVKLSLATGAPLSFASDLRTPRFVHRPDASSIYEGQPADGPVLSERGMGDRDGDGIPDSTDKCPDSPEDSDGDVDGCPEVSKKKMVKIDSNAITILQHIMFANGSDAIAPASGPILDATAATLKQNPEISRLILEGHTSTDEKDSWALAARRAGVVRAALVARGVTTELTVQAFADTRPLGSDAAQNRRVELRIADAHDGRKQPESENGVVQARALERTASVAKAPRDIAGSTRYDINDTVSIPKHASSLVTIVNEYLPGEDVLLYRPDANVRESTHRPFRAARLSSPGTLGLQPGSVAIFSGGAFVGEGILMRLNPGETALIPYSLDGATEVRTHYESADKPSRIVAVSRGQLTVEDLATRTTHYEITPGKQVPARIVVRHERLAQYTADGLPPGTESTPDTYLIPIPITPERASSLVVEEKWMHQHQISVGDVAAATLGLYLTGSKLPPEVEKLVLDVSAARTEIEKTNAEIESLRTRIGDEGARAGEIRESLRAVEKTPHAAALQKDLTTHLAAATAAMDDLTRALAEKNLAFATSKARLADAVRALRALEPGT